MAISTSHHPEGLGTFSASVSPKWRTARRRARLFIAVACGGTRSAKRDLLNQCEAEAREELERNPSLRAHELMIRSARRLCEELCKPALPSVDAREHCGREMRRCDIDLGLLGRLHRFFTQRRGSTTHAAR